MKSFANGSCSKATSKEYHGYTPARQAPGAAITQSKWRHLTRGQSAQLHTFELLTGTKKLVYASESSVFEAPNWTADGKWLVFNSDGLLYKIAPEENQVPILIDTHPVADANNDHVLSPNGDVIYFSTTDGHVFAVPFAGGPPRRVSNDHAYPFRYYLHGISPDGSVLAFIGHDARAHEETFDIYTMPAAGGGVERLTTSKKHNDGVEYSPDGQWLYFNSERASSIAGHSQLFRMRTDGTQVTQLTFDERVNWFPHVSPDGENIVYLSYPPQVQGHPANQPVSLRLLHAAGEFTELLTLMGGQGTINVNSWSPDSTRFAFVEYPS